jgi:hypothetical protein
MICYCAAQRSNRLRTPTLSYLLPCETVLVKNQRHSRLRSSERLRLLADRELLGDEGERDLGHVMPPVVNDQGVPATSYFAELRDRGIVLLQLVFSRDDRQGDRMVFLATAAIPFPVTTPMRAQASWTPARSGGR